MIIRCIGGELLLFGGNANNGTNCGLVYANSNYAFSNSNSNIAARTTSHGIGQHRCRNYKDGRIVYIQASDHREPSPLVRMYSQEGQNNESLCGNAKASTMVLVGFSRKFHKDMMQG